MKKQRFEELTEAQQQALHQRLMALRQSNADGFHGDTKQTSARRRRKATKDEIKQILGSVKHEQT